MYIYVYYICLQIRSILNPCTLCILQSCIRKASDAADPGKALAYFVATGNLRSESGLDLQQTAGFTIVSLAKN